MRRWPASHCLRAFIGEVSGSSVVPGAWPSTSSVSTSGRRPEAMVVMVPERAASAAARTLVVMPPRPRPEPPPPAMAARAGSEARALGIRRAAGFCLGSASNRPSWSVRITNRSASTRLATRAARVSLSPKRISSVTTVSFSLTTGTTEKPSSVSRVLRAFR